MSDRRTDRALIAGGLLLLFAGIAQQVVSGGPLLDLDEAVNGALAGLRGPGLVGLSRLVLAAHYLSDVLAGVLLGGLWALLAAALADRLWRDHACA